MQSPMTQYEIGDGGHWLGAGGGGLRFCEFPHPTSPFIIISLQEEDCPVTCCYSGSRACACSLERPNINVHQIFVGKPGKNTRTPIGIYMWVYSGLWGNKANGCSLAAADYIKEDNEFSGFLRGLGSRGSVVVWGTLLQEGRLRVRETMTWIFSIYLILQAILGPEVYPASNRMSTRSRKIMFLGSRARPVRRADKLTAICEPVV
jgi:hypothetical protein